MYNRYISRDAPEPVEVPAAERPAASPLSGILDTLRALPQRLKGEGGSLLSGIPLLEKLDSGDLLLILVLIFLFQESEDEEWLIILALVLLMGL